MNIFFLACLLATGLLASTSAQAKLLDSPDVRQIWNAAELHSKKFYWDDETHRFVVALTYAAPGHAEQTAHFHFPHIQKDAEGKHFTLDLGNGRPATLAHKLFWGDVILERDDHLLIHRRHGVVRVTLDINEG